MKLIILKPSQPCAWVCNPIGEGGKGNLLEKFGLHATTLVWNFLNAFVLNGKCPKKGLLFINIFRWQKKKNHAETNTNLNLCLIIICCLKTNTEAECRSLAISTADLFWLRMLFKELFFFPLSLPPILWCDNVSALSLASNPVFHACMKHIEVVGLSFHSWEGS